MSHHVPSAGGVNPAQRRATLAAQLKAKLANITRLAQRAPIKGFAPQASLPMRSPAFMPLNQRLSERSSSRTQDNKKTTAGEEQRHAKVEGADKSAAEYEGRNPELSKRGLMNLRVHVTHEDSPEEILRKVLQSYPDHFLADEAMEFLLDTTDPSTKFGANLRTAQELLHDRYGREVRAGRNMNEEAREFSKQGLGSPGALRDVYRAVTAEPRSAMQLYEELSKKFRFTTMKTLIQFLLHSTGSDLKSKGPSISRAELQIYLSEIRNMQAIVGVYHFFSERMMLIRSLFNNGGVQLPQKLTFELLAKVLMMLIRERYPSPDRVSRFSQMLGIDKNTLAQIIVYQQYRDAMRGIAPRMFRSERHRQDLLMTLIDTLSDLDDEIEEDKDESPEERRKRKQERG